MGNRLILLAATGLLSAVGGGFVSGEEKPVPEISPGGGVKPAGLNVPPASSESSSGQFIVFGESLPLRSSFSVAAEDIKKDLLKLLGRDDQWDARILILVKNEPAPGRSVVPRVFALDDGAPHFQLDVTLNADFRRAEFSQQLLRLLLAENMLRRGGLSAGKVVSLPDWVAVGISEAIEFRKRSRPSGRFAAVFQSGKNLDIDEILKATPWGMDTVSREIYETSCCALMETLLGQPGGLDRMRKFIADLGDSRGAAKDLLYQHFPGLGISEDSLDKWWALQMATLAKGGTFEALTAQETEARLQAALTFHFSKERENEKRSFLKRIFGNKNKDDEEAPVRPEVVLGADEPADVATDETEVLTLADYEQILVREDREIPLRQSARRLADLRVRAFPLYRPLISSYEDVLGALVAGKEKNVGEAIAALALSRTETLARVNDVESYLDWFEGTQVQSKSGAFDGYQRAVKELDALDARRRSDPISRYLDALEKEF